MDPAVHAAFEQLTEKVRQLNLRVDQLTRKPTTELPYQAEWMPRFVELFAQYGTKKAAHSKMKSEGLGPSWSGLYSYLSRCPKFKAELDATAKELAGKKQIQPTKADQRRSRRKRRGLEGDPEPWRGMRRAW